MRPIFRVAIFGTLFGFLSDIIGIYVFHAFQYWNPPFGLIINMPLWSLYWIVMYLALPKYKIGIFLVGFYAIIWDILTVRVGFLWYTISAKYQLCLGIPLGELGWVIIFPLIYWISLNLFDYIDVRTNRFLAWALTILTIIILAPILSSIYILPIQLGYL